MGWIDLETGEPVSPEDLQALQAPSAKSRPIGRARFTPPEQAQPAVHDFPSAAASLGDQFAQGAMSSLKRTYLGLKQLATYVGGNDEAKQAVNDEIARMEQEYGPALASPAGKIGNVAGTLAQFAVPGAVAGIAGRAAPAAAAAMRTVTGAPGSVGRAALTTGAFEAAQPVNTGNTDTQDQLVARAMRGAMGAGLGAGAAGIANRLTRSGPAIQPELKGLTKRAEEAGFKGGAALTPAQRTQDRYLLQKEEGFLSSPGSSNLIATRRKAQQDVIDEAASKVLGAPGQKPTEAIFGAAREKANAAYAPIARVPSIREDGAYLDDLMSLAKSTKSRDVARTARQIRENGALPGDAFLEHLQDVRTLASDAGKAGQQYTAKEYGKLATSMENLLDRQLSELAKTGSSGVTPDTIRAFRDARTDLSAIRALERSTDPVRGTVSPNKVLSEQFRRQRPGSKPTPTTQRLQQVSDAARVMRETMPYIGSSGTAERLMGQKIVEAESSPVSAIRFMIPSIRNYLAAKHYLNHGADPGVLNNLHPEFKNALRRYLPPATLGAAEGMSYE